MYAGVATYAGGIRNPRDFQGGSITSVDSRGSPILYRFYISSMSTLVLLCYTIIHLAIFLPLQPPNPHQFSWMYSPILEKHSFHRNSPYRLNAVIAYAMPTTLFPPSALLTGGACRRIMTIISRTLVNNYWPLHNLQRVYENRSFVEINLEVP